ncbi:MAG: VOC family protein [Alphaproteobacteria bacterium]
MAAFALDHVNLQTARTDQMVAFYRDIVGLELGARPDFDVPGAWLYLGDLAAVHLVTLRAGLQPKEPQIEHFAFRCRGLKRFTALCREKRVPYYVAIVPGLDIRQVNVFDPDGNKVEMQFEATDDPDTDLSPHLMQAPA